MDNITITLTPDQRVILINALAYWAEERKNKYDYTQIQELYAAIASTKCGDRYCSYCGELKYQGE